MFSFYNFLYVKTTSYLHNPFYTTAIDAIEGYASSLFMQSDLTYILYWLQLTTYVNFIMDGLTKQAENSYKTGIPNISRWMAFLFRG